MGKRRRVAIYVRVSTVGQTTSNQQRELDAAVERHDWKVVEVFKDQGISGKNGREQRPAFDRLLRGSSGRTSTSLRRGRWTAWAGHSNTS